MPLYHYQIGFPQGLVFKPIFGFNYSNHARLEALSDRYGKIENLPQNFLPRVDKVIEVETDDLGNVIKVVFRKHYNAEFDVVVVLYVPTKTVKTLWLNAKSDQHRTLDRTKYDTP